MWCVCEMCCVVCATGVSRGHWLWAPSTVTSQRKCVTETIAALQSFTHLSFPTHSMASSATPSSPTALRSWPRFSFHLLILPTVHCTPPPCSPPPPDTAHCTLHPSSLLPSTASAALPGRCVGSQDTSWPVAAGLPVLHLCSLRGGCGRGVAMVLWPHSRQGWDEAGPACLHLPAAPDEGTAVSV